MAYAERALLDAFEEALAGHLVLTKLEECLDERRRAQTAPKPIQKQIETLKKEVDRLIVAIANGGEVPEIVGAIHERRARLAVLETHLADLGTLPQLDLKSFAKMIEPVLKNWQAHLKAHPQVAQTVLRKILPEKVTVTPLPEGGWQVTGMANYTEILSELGLDAVKKVLLQALPKVSRTGRHSVQFGKAISEIVESRSLGTRPRRV